MLLPNFLVPIILEWTVNVRSYKQKSILDEEETLCYTFQTSMSTGGEKVTKRQKSVPDLAISQWIAQYLPSVYEAIPVSFHYLQ